MYVFYETWLRTSHFGNAFLSNISQTTGIITQQKIIQRFQSFCSFNLLYKITIITNSQVKTKLFYLIIKMI